MAYPWLCLFFSQIASKRCHSDYTDECVIPQLGSGPVGNNSGSGYYTVQDYQEILKYANDLHIEVIPEVDMPGHSVAAIAAMEERERKLDKKRQHFYAKQEESFLLRDREPVSPRPRTQKRFEDDMNPCLNSTYRYAHAKYLHKLSFC